jgi:hypothetical protein
MGNRIALTAGQEELKQRLQESFNLVREGSSARGFGESYNEAFNEMSELAYQLATSLTIPPVFTQDILYGAEDLTPADRAFYNHQHVVEDLLNYLEDDEANNPPVATTETFEFRVHTNRWGHEDVIHLTRNEEGWNVSSNLHGGQADIEAGPNLYQVLQHDSVSYPYDLRGYMARTWQNASNGASREEIQEQLNAIARWISDTERNKPYTL